MSLEWCKQDGDAVLLVEGQSDCHVTLALCNQYNVPEKFGIYDCESDTNVLKRMNALINRPDPPRVIGIVLDADNPNLRARWVSLQNKLAGNGYVLPEDPGPKGTILSNGNTTPRLGIWLMPNNQTDGMLEDFCCEMIAPEAISTVQMFVDDAKLNGPATFKDAHRSKAIVHTYLAIQDEPGRALGQSITAHVLRSDTATTEHFVKWLRELFDI